MKVVTTGIPDLLILEPKVFGDERGFFTESWNARTFSEATGVETPFVQDNHSRSHRGVLRGLHFQVERPQGKLVRVVNGVVFDVAVDLRANSPTFGKWEGVELSDANKRQVWIPPGFAHGFLVLSKTADFLYKTTEYYAPELERCLAWNDPDVGVKWPLNTVAPSISPKDALGQPLREHKMFELAFTEPRAN